MSLPFENPADPAPSYEESVRPASSTTADGEDTKQASRLTHPPALPLQHELANARSRRINDILSTYVDPLLAAQGAAGLYKTTFVLVPSTVSNLRVDCSSSSSDAFSAPQEPEIMGFPANEAVKLVRLRAEEHAMEFWQQPAVVAELESSMKARLTAFGHRVYDSTSPSGNTATHPSTPTPSSAKEPKKSVWERLKGHHDEIVDRKLGWRAAEPQDETLPEHIPTGMVMIRVVWKDISLRVANDLGLLESKHGPALCLTVEVGT